MCDCFGVRDSALAHIHLGVGVRLVGEFTYVYMGVLHV